MKVNDRKDIVTNKRFKREELIRVSILKDGTTSIDENYSMGGRGIYIHPTSIDNGINRGVIKKQIKRFKGDPEAVLQQLIERKQK